jgi:hypothetical protein
MGKAPASANPWYAAAITAGTRAQILRAALQAPDKIVMLATDGIISQTPLDLDCPSKKSLGTWEKGALSKGGLFVQSGVYAISDETGDYHSKSRGFRPDNIKSSDQTLAEYLIETIPPLWKIDAASLSFDYNFYQTLGSAIAGEDAYRFIGMWGKGTRELDLRKSGVKRVVRAASRKRRAVALVASFPADHNKFVLDEAGELCLSAPSMPEWLDLDLGEASREISEYEEIFAARFASE